MLNCPLPSVTTVRVFSISTGLEASTVTPGRTASDGSLTTPVMVPSACADKRGRDEEADNQGEQPHCSLHDLLLRDASPAQPARQFVGKPLPHVKKAVSRSARYTFVCSVSMNSTTLYSPYTALI